MDFEISAINDNDEKNYKLVREGIGDAAYFPDAVLGVYAGQHELLVRLLQTDQEKHAGALLFGLCIKHLVTGANNLFRGHAGVMYRETRGAIEAAGLAHRLLNDKRTFDTYLADQEYDEVARQAFKDQTRRNQLFPQNAPKIIQKLGEHYDYASKKAHTNRMNFLRNVAYSEAKGLSEMNLRDFAQENIIPKLPLELGWMCGVHLDILLASCLVIFKHPSVDFSEIIDIQNEVWKRLAAFLVQYGGATII